MTEHKCIVCGKAAPFTWFCSCCTLAKEKAYKECRELGISNFYEVLSYRDKALSKHLEEGECQKVQQKI